MAVQFCPIASGSSGNSVFVGTENTKILIDAGLSGKRIEAGLNSIQVTGADLDAILITHEHSDHVQGAGILSRRFDVPIYATPGTWNAMERDNSLGKINPKNKMFVYAEEKVIFNDMWIKPFDIPHDAAEPVGFNIFAQDYKISVATDMGHILDGVKESIFGSDILLIESNHDEEMLKNGRYPIQLKRRILSDTGHLSNVCCGQFIKEIMCGKLKHIFLGHLSEENNRPLLAYETVKSIMMANNIEVGRETKLYLAERHRASNMLSLG